MTAGPREAERQVVAWVLEHRARSLSELDPPIRIVVPSRSLVRHLGAVLVREVGATAGVVVQTHRALAREVLERAGEDLPPGASLAQELLVRRFAAAEPALADALDDVEDGYAPVAASVRDLVDAGFTPELLPAALDALRGSGLGSGRLERAEAVLRVGAKVLDESARLGCPHRGTLLERAAKRLTEEPELVRARRVVLHGFAEATGLVTALLAALVDSCGAEVILDLPPDPALPERPDSGGRFADRLAVALHGGSASPPASFPDPPRIELFRAPGPEAEIREVAARVRRLLDDGVAPESVAVVARSVDADMAASVRRQLFRMGVPLSGEGVTVSAGSSGRRAAALLELLSDQGRAELGAWLIAAPPNQSGGDPAVLELALRTAGMVRLGDLESLHPERLCPRGVLRIPVVEGIEEEAGEVRRLYASFPKDGFEVARREALNLLAILERRPTEGPIDDFLAWIRDVLDGLGVSKPHDFRGALAALESEIPSGLPMAWDHLQPVLARRLSGGEEERLGGAGGGVQMLTVTEARGRTFEHLFVVGLNRGLFPRILREDAILPEPVRRAVAKLLPEMPLAERGHLEEKYLFAQLMASSPRITLSWQTVDADGRPRNPSAFVERLRLEGRLPEETSATVDVFGARPSAELRPALEHAGVFALARRRDGLAAAAAALGDGRVAHLEPLLDELDPLQPRNDFGPFLGITGTAPPSKLWVTHLEAFSGCPWRQFLERELGLAPPPEARPAATSLKGRLVGLVVHRVLEEMVRKAGGPKGRAARLDDVAAAEPVEVPWPDQTRLASMAKKAAQRVATEEGVPALAPALSQLALPYLETASRLEWEKGTRAVLGAEVVGTCELAPRGAYDVTVRFRADRVDRNQDDALVLTDYKTGGSPTVALGTALLRGQRLQAAAYASGAGGRGIGRYLYLDAGSKKVEETITSDETGELAGVVDLLLAAWKTGVLLPRWETPTGVDGPVCRYCSVREACFRDDSTFRARLARALDHLEARKPGDPLIALWKLPAKKASRGSA